MKRPAETLQLIALLLASAGLTIGLTFAPCHASLCVEEFYPRATRLHLASFYAILAGAAIVLLLRARIPSCRRLSEHYLVRRELPLLRKRISVGGLFLAVLLVGPSLATTAFWLRPTIEYWKARADVLASYSVQVQLVATGIIAHHVDILLGMLLIPVSRNSLLGRVFGVHQSTLLYSHKLLSYLTFVGVIAHGIVSLIFVGTWNAAAEDDPIKELFDVYNPTLTVAEAKARGPWVLGVLPTGVILLVLFVAIVATSLPVVRRRSYNLFYYTHIFCVVGILICASIHASTDFYFILPGLVLWLGDLIWRQVRGYSGLSKTVNGQLEAAEGGWYRITLPVAAKTTASVDLEKDMPVATHPLQSFNLVIPAVSKIQNHAFTAAVVGDMHQGPVFLLQRATGKKETKLVNEWTWKLGAITDSADKAATTKIRVEGPYVPSVPELWTASDVVCIVGGTGLTGAYSLALWWAHHRARASASSFTLVWTARYAETAQLAEWQQLQKVVDAIDNMTLVLQITSEQGRLNARDVLDTSLTSPAGQEQGSLASRVHTRDRRAWVYISGPESLLASIESACMDVQRDIARRKSSPQRMSLDRLDYYSAKWEV